MGPGRSADGARQPPAAPSLAGCAALLALGPLPLQVAAAPTVTIIAPTDGQLVQGSLYLYVTASGGVDRVEFRVDGLHFSDMGTSGGGDYVVSWNTTLWADGPHHFTFVAVNGTSGSTTAGVWVVIDNRPPTGSGGRDASARADLETAALGLMDMMGPNDRLAIFAFGDDGSGLLETSTLYQE